MRKIISFIQNRFFVHTPRDCGSLPTLDDLGNKYGTDKTRGHFYGKPYSMHFENKRLDRVKLLEIGIGGYSDTSSGGGSLRMWKDYFPNGTIFGVDIHDKTGLQEDRIVIYQADQRSSEQLNGICAKTGELDITIDDGSHINSDVITTFEILFRKLKIGGIYVVEDTQTSYWKSCGGDSEDLNNPKTTMNYFKALTDSLNNQEFIREDYVQTYFDKHVTSIHFYHNLIFIYKGDNNEPSNMVVNNKFYEKH